MQTLDGVQDNIDKIAALFPNCITERKDAEGKVTLAIDFDKLRQELSSEIVEGREERYQFTWPDKKKAILLANSPINATLRPCREESVDFDNTQNLYIEGDNLDVLKCLKETYLGKVKMIYIDPPYNTGNDFVYEDDFAESTSEYLANSGQYDEQGNRLVTNSESNGRFHTDWLNMIYPRLKVARDLLTEDGVIFISIDDNELENLKKVCNEIFGEENFIGQISVVNNLKGRNDKKDIATCHEYILIFSKSEFAAGGMPLTEEQRRSFNLVDKNGNPYQLRDLRKRGRPDRREDRPNMYFPIYYNEETKKCSLDYHEGWVAIVPLRGDGSDGRWRWGKERVLANLSILEPYYSNISHKWGIQHRVYLNPVLAPSADFDDEYDEVQERVSKSKSFWMGGELSTDVGRRQMKELFNNAYFDYPKSVALILNTMYLGSDTNSIILDFFSGSATTAHAVMQLNAEDGGNRKFIMVQLPELTDEKSEVYKAGYKNICEIGKERIRRAGKKIKNELAAKQQESGLFIKQEEEQTLDVGFRVLKLDSSNLQDIYYSPAEYNQNDLFTKTESVKSDRTSEDLLFQVMLELGATLDSKIEQIEIEDKTIYNVANNYLVACFDNEIDDSVVTTIAKTQPQYAVFRDSTIVDDSTATNFEQIFKTYSPNTVTKVL
jgi:site-specific DNA-methyltransferase (adenine-specific)